MRLTLAFICAALLCTACGGGDEDVDVDQPTCSVDGQPRPAEVCR